MPILNDTFSDIPRRDKSNATPVGADIFLAAEISISKIRSGGGRGGGGGIYSHCYGTGGSIDFDDGGGDEV